MRGAFEGIKVLDFSWLIAGPMLTAYFADHGATVIKVENSVFPDPIRSFAPYKDGLKGVNRSGSFVQWNNSKHSITLNLKHPKGAETILRLVSWADVVVESYGVGGMERWELGYERLREVNPSLVMLRISLLGQTGSSADFKGYGYHAQALSGVVDLTGWPDRPPVPTSYPYADIVAPWFGIMALIAALFERNETGKGQCIDLNLYETTLRCLEPAIVLYSTGKKGCGRQGNRSPYGAPHGAFPCSGEDSWCAVAVFTEEEWQNLVKAMGNPEWTYDSKFKDFKSRKINEDEVDSLLGAWIKKFSSHDLMHLLQRHGISAGVVQNAREVHEDPQLEHRNHFVSLDHPEIGECRHQTWPAKFSKTPCRIRRHAPCLGQHNRHVFTNILGFSEEEFIELGRSGVID